MGSGAVRGDLLWSVVVDLDFFVKFLKQSPHLYSLWVLNGSSLRDTFVTLARVSP